MAGFGLAGVVRLGLLASHSQTQSLLDSLGILIGTFGLVPFTAGVVAHVFGPLRHGRNARTNCASYATILGCLYLAVVLAEIATIVYSVGGNFAGNLLGNPLPASHARAPLAASTLSTPNGLIVATLAQEMSLIVVVYLRIVRPIIITWNDMGISSRTIGRHLVLGLFAAAAVLAAIGILETLLSFFGIRQTQAELFRPLRQGTVIQFVLMLLAAGLLTGLAEESFFRGYAFAAIQQTKGLWQAYAASSAIFAAAHLPLWQAFLPLFAAGLILAYAYHKSRSIVPGIVAHAVNNAVGLTVIYFGMA